jgi:hypothetical protein
MTDCYAQPENSPLSPPLTLLTLLDGMWVARAIHVAAQLGLADLLSAGPKEVEALADETQTHLPSLYRLLRALGSAGVFQEVAPHCFANTPLSTALRSDLVPSCYSVALLRGADWHWRTLGGLLYSVQTGAPAFHLFHNMDLWTYLRAHPEDAQLYYHTLAVLARINDAAIVQAYDFSQFHVVMELAEGTGAILPAILRHLPSLQGILFNRPEMIEEARAMLAQERREQRCEVRAIDFSTPLPGGADAILLRQVLCNHSQEQVFRILTACRKALPPWGKLLIIEHLVPAPPVQDPAAWFMDLERLVLTAEGRERTEEAYQALLKATGFALRQVLATTSPLSILEAEPV